MLTRLTIYSLLISWLCGFLVATSVMPRQYVDTSAVYHKVDTADTSVIQENYTGIAREPVIDTMPVIHHEYSIAEWIVVSAEKNGVDPVVALRIADCESKLGTQNHNKQGSSAKGVYMFIDSTWDNYCEGDVLNQNDNIACFMKLYKQHPSWWSCK